jgi:hypothetical protein
MSSYTPAPLVQPGSQATGSAKSPTPAHTSTSSSVTHYTREQAQAYALTAFQNAIGRAPTSQELDTFVTSFNAGQNPSSTITNYAAGGKSYSSSTTGGVDEAMLAQNIAQQNPEYANYQKATTYFDVFNQVMNGRGGAGL